MSNATATPEATKHAIDGILRMKKTVALTPKEDGTERSMAILQIATENDVVRITDFSKQNEHLAKGDRVTVVYEETVGVKDGYPVTYRNLVDSEKE